MKKISAIIACYKDAEAIPEMHQRLTSVLTKTKFDYEIAKLIYKKKLFN